MSNESISRASITFITRFINNSPDVKSSRIDKTIKAIINNLRTRRDLQALEIIEYLNKVRIIYFIKRLKYYNFAKYKEILGKYNIK